MEAIPNSRKRNHPSRTPTRSRSQLFLHLNRSGQFRFYPRPRKDQPYPEIVPFGGNPLSCKKAKRHDDELSGLPAKDLRARRVYSPPQSSPSDLIGSGCTDRKIAELGFGSSPGKGGVRIEATESPDLGFSCKTWGFDGGNTDSPNESSKLLDRKRCDGTNSCDYSEKIDDLDGEHVLKTPPGAEICGNSKVNEDEVKREEDVRVKDAGEGFPQKDRQRNDSALKSKSVLGPRFHGKLFKAPGSVNYRRLFPFLMDTMGSDSGTPKLGICQKDEKGMDGPEFQLTLSCQSQEPSKQELKTDSCTMHGTNGLNLTSSHYLVESPMQLDLKEVVTECLSMPPVDDKCLSESKADATAEFHAVKDVGSSLHNDDFKQYSAPKTNIDYAKASNPDSCTSQQSGVLNEECILTIPPDAETYDNSAVIVDQLESMPLDMHHVKPTDLARSTQEVNDEGLCLKADKGKDSLKRKLVPGQHLHRKLFKAPGSVGYKRMLPFLMDLTKDDSGTLKFGHQTHHQEDEVDINAKRFQLPLSFHCEEASIDEHKTDSSPVDGTVESNGLENNILVNPSHRNQPKLTPSQYLSKLPMQLDAKEVVHEGLSAPSVKEDIEKFVIGYKDECLSESKFDPCSVMVDNIHSAKNAANGAHDDDFKQVQNRISGQHSESPPKYQNVLNINGDVSDFTFEHHSSRLTVDYDENKQLVNLEEFESVGRCPPEGQSPNQLDPNMLDAEENGTGSHTISRSDDSVVLNHVQVSNEGPRSPSQKAISEKLDMAGHGSDEAGSVLNGIIFDSRTPSIASDNKNASEIESGSESKTISVLKRCPRIKLLKHAGSFNYKRLLPFLLSTMKDNPCGSVNDHCPKLQKFLDQTPLPISASNLRVTPISESNGCVPAEQHCAGNSSTRQQKGLHACDFKNDSSSPKSDIGEFQSSRDSCKVYELQDEQVVSNVLCKLESATDPSISVHGIDLPIIPLAPIINDTREEKATSALSKSSVFSEVKGNSPFLISSNEKAPEAERHECCQSLSQLKVCEQLRVTAIGFKRGILKRNPRGCRGLCTCLNCVSFRLHAERAFEFSRNQLLDAEEVAHDLMKELSHLRNMLERSTDSVKNTPVLDTSQVQEACRKALAVEQLAKDRLSQMNDDLNIHCRITSLQRPRVTFADHVEEKVIRPGG